MPQVRPEWNCFLWIHTLRIPSHLISSWLEWPRVASAPTVQWLGQLSSNPFVLHLLICFHPAFHLLLHLHPIKCQSIKLFQIHLPKAHLMTFSAQRKKIKNWHALDHSYRSCLQMTCLHGFLISFIWSLNFHFFHVFSSSDEDSLSKSGIFGSAKGSQWSKFVRFDLSQPEPTAVLPENTSSTLSSDHTVLDFSTLNWDRSLRFGLYKHEEMQVHLLKSHDLIYCLFTWPKSL